ncbi:MAG: hypothetical protein M1829_003535 [Trizodia sp. TS-e1964]|nr:MAG: hypothetical protein M1829_003535 [Trizodia sp. TS-e1964]
MPDGCTNEEPSVRHITLVGEENLEIVKQLFLKITSIHIYSLQPCPLKDFQILCNSAQLGIDSLESRKIYGSIQNLEMKTRGRTAPLPNPPAAPKATNSKPASKIEAVKELKQKAPEVHASVIKTQARQKSLKRDSSDIFKAFSKTKPKLKGKESQSEATSPVADSPVASASEDDPMKDVGDDDDDDTFVPPPSRNLNKAESNSRAKEMARKKEELTRMMDDNDEPMPDSSAPNEQDSQESIATDANQSQDTQTSIVQPIQSSGRRRGKRRVVKKKTVKDAEGYIVTIEEPAWESYSEDEPAPVSKPQQSHASHASKSSGKSKRGGGAASKGNIASFFSKK